MAKTPKIAKKIEQVDALEHGDYLELENMDLKLKLWALEDQRLKAAQRALSNRLCQKYNIVAGDSLGANGEIIRAPKDKLNDATGSAAPK